MEENINQELIESTLSTMTEDEKKEALMLLAKLGYKRKAQRRIIKERRYLKPYYLRINHICSTCKTTWTENFIMKQSNGADYLQAIRLNEIPLNEKVKITTTHSFTCFNCPPFLNSLEKATVIKMYLNERRNIYRGYY